jgi:hypothetical protein
MQYKLLKGVVSRKFCLTLLVKNKSYSQVKGILKGQNTKKEGSLMITDTNSQE